MKLLLLNMLLLHPASQDRDRNYSELIERSPTLKSHEQIIRKLGSQGKLGQLCNGYKSVWSNKKSLDVAFGYIRCRTIHFDLMPIYGKHFPVIKELSHGDLEFYNSVAFFSARMHSDAWSVAGYYLWLNYNREPGMKPPVTVREERTGLFNGKPQKYTYTLIIADPAKDARKKEIFERAWKLDPKNPMVLKIAATRKQKSDPAAAISFMSKALDNGGMELFPEDGLYFLYDLSRKTGKTSESKAWKEKLVKHLDANKTSFWTKVFYARHPNFKR